MSIGLHIIFIVIPAKAGIQGPWVPAFAGTMAGGMAPRQMSLPLSRKGIRRGALWA